MRKGELARFLLTPYYGFRELGCPPRVPPNVPGWHNLKMPNVQFFFLLLMYNSNNIFVGTSGNSSKKKTKL